LGAGTLIAIGLVTTQLIVIFGFLLLERRQPAATLAWIFAVLFLPLLGVLLYFWLGMKRVVIHSRRSSEAADKVQGAIAAYQLTGYRTGAGGLGYGPHVATLVRLGEALVGPATRGNRCRLLINGAATYRAIIQAIQAAEDHLHLESYIIQPDDTGTKLRDRLTARAQEGIRVRVLYDAVGSAGLPRDFWAPLLEAGGQALAWSPVGPWNRLRSRDRIDFRNHRKNIIVDGKVGFTGGINVGREYLGLDPEIGHWRDTHVRIEGPAVHSLQRIFAEDWFREAGELLGEARYFPQPTEAPPAEEAIVQILDSGPNRSWAPIHRVYNQAIALATERVWITSPYFVPDAVIEEALTTAALRGVDVRLLLPAKSDVALVSIASRAYYGQLLDAGVRIFEYARGFVHAKTLVVDDWLATVGSANMDIRSFHLNYELNALVLGRDFNVEVRQSFLDDLSFAREIERSAVASESYPKRIVQAVARLLSPLL
jgi:cardiolipin synthase